MLWTADSVEYRSVSMCAAFSGDTLIWIKGGTPIKLTKITSINQITVNSDVIVIGCPGTNGFVTKNFYSDPSIGDNIVWETVVKPIIGDYILDDQILLKTKANPGSGPNPYSGNWFDINHKIVNPGLDSLYINSIPDADIHYLQVVDVHANGYLFTQNDTGVIFIIHPDTRYVYALVAYNNSTSPGFYEGLKFENTGIKAYIYYISGRPYYDPLPDLTQWTPPTGSNFCYLYKVESVQ